MIDIGARRVQQELHFPSAASSPLTRQHVRSPRHAVRSPASLRQVESPLPTTHDGGAVMMAAPHDGGALFDTRRGASPVAGLRAGTSRSPFRDVLLPRDASSREARLIEMISDFTAHGLSRKLDDLRHRVKKSNYLSDDDRVFLSTMLDRNNRFMANVERLLGEAVQLNEAMERSAVKRCHAQWSLCNTENRLIQSLVATHAVGPQGRRSPSPYTRGTMSIIRGSASRSTSRTAAAAVQLMNVAAQLSPPDPGAFERLHSLRSTTPRSSSAAGRLDGRSGRDASLHTARGARLSTARTPPAVTEQRTKASSHAHDVESITTKYFGAGKSFVNPDEAKAAQDELVARFGEHEGKARFMEWLHGLPIDTLRALQTQLAAR